jgi:hypothetical protein
MQDFLHAPVAALLCSFEPPGSAQYNLRQHCTSRFIGGVDLLTDQAKTQAACTHLAVAVGLHEVVLLLLLQRWVAQKGRLPSTDATVYVFTN